MKNREHERWEEVRGMSEEGWYGKNKSIGGIKNWKSASNYKI